MESSHTDDEAWLEHRKASKWSDSKHTSSVQTDVLYPIAHFVFDVAGYDKNVSVKNGVKILNLSYGEPTRENGFVVPQSITDAVVEAA